MATLDERKCKVRSRLEITREQSNGGVEHQEGSMGDLLGVGDSGHEPGGTWQRRLLELFRRSHGGCRAKIRISVSRCDG